MTIHEIRNLDGIPDDIEVIDLLDRDEFVGKIKKSSVVNYCLCGSTELCQSI
ncbi:hypothetical protein [Wohlfahrtiimonas chitiniclastica]|uniref:hypothetical protein n=1 Tax=Wohlfahrtiimonas chitiniclastica TaxID=400946 RepID=UPI0015C5B746|nr:hypothetical protein [Wohlfahrtiimonas chitiniclastica]